MNAKHLLIAAATTALIAGNAQATVVVSTETDIAPGGTALDPYTPTFAAGGPSGSDLLEGLSALSSAGNFQLESSTGLSALTNGSVATYYPGGPGDYPLTHSAYATGDDSNGGQEAVYDLGAAYDLTEIVIYGGWLDGGRDQQNVDVLVSTDNVSFTSLGATLGGNTGGSNPISHRNSITDDGGTLASNVRYIKLDFGHVENNYAGYSEVDVFGVPEPSSLALLGIGGLLIARRRRG